MKLLDRLLGRKPPFPTYTLLRVKPELGVPEELASLESSPGFAAAQEEIRARLLAPDRRPAPDRPLFCSLAGRSGEVTLPLPDGGGMALLLFSSPARASDYCDVHGLGKAASGFKLRSPRELAASTAQLQGTDVRLAGWVLDRCPRCQVVCVHPLETALDPGPAIDIWVHQRAAQQARCDAEYLHAVRAARAGELDEALGVALHIVGHVTPEDPRVHVLIGKLAQAIGDDVGRATLPEAKAFLAALGQKAPLEELGAAERATAPSF